MFDLFLSLEVWVYGVGESFYSVWYRVYDLGDPGSGFVFWSWGWPVLDDFGLLGCLRVQVFRGLGGYLGFGAMSGIGSIYCGVDFQLLVTLSTGIL